MGVQEVDLLIRNPTGAFWELQKTGVQAPTGGVQRAPPLTRNSLGFEGTCCGDMKAAATRGMMQVAVTGGRRRR